MKTLRMTVLIEPGVSKAELANMFGSFEEFTITNRYIQFQFNNIKMLTGLQIRGICKLIQNYELTNSVLRFKMLHLFDDRDKSYSPVNIQCWSGEWRVVVTDTGIEVNKSKNLLTLI